MPDFRLSETTIAGTPPEKAKARVCEPIQPGSDCVPWSPSTGTGGRHRLEMLVAINRKPRSPCPGARNQADKLST